MPYLELITNVKVNDAKAFALEFSKLAAAILNQPELYISVNVTYNEILTFGGSFDPAFILTVTSLENLTEAYSKTLFDFFEKKLGVPGSRGYIAFMNPGKGSIGHEGTTLATLFAK